MYFTSAARVTAQREKKMAAQSNNFIRPILARKALIDNAPCLLDN